MGQFGIGQPVTREEDPKLLLGKGSFVDDVRVPGTASAVVVRSPHAHARILTLDVAAVRAAPGVLCVLTGRELAQRGLGTLLPEIPRKRSDGTPAPPRPQPLLAGDRVRFVGDAVAFIVAETLDAAKDAAELMAVDYEILPAVTTAAEALAPGAPAVWEDNPGNEAFFHEVGDSQGVEAAFAEAAQIIRHTVVINRVSANSIEPRGCLGSYDAIEDRYTIRCTIQGAHGTKATLADRIFKLPQTRFRVVCGNMGGGFGMKGGCYPEYALSLWASEVTGRPVKWIAERSEGLISDEQARDSTVQAEMALDAEGHILALRTHSRVPIGAYFSSERNVIPTIVALGCLASTYRTPAIHARVTGLFANIMNIAFYRGGGRPEPAYVIEVMVDKAARAMGMTPEAFRRINTVPTDAMPFTNALKQVYDCGDFLKNLDDCKARIDYADAETRRAEARSRGQLLGIGVSNTISAAGSRGWEHAEVRFDPSGAVTLITGAMDHGQGHGTTFKQVLSEKLGMDHDLIHYQFGDTDQVAMGTGTFGSRSACLAGSAVFKAADKIIEKGRLLAAHLMEAAEGDVEFADGKFTVAGTDKSLDLAQIAQTAFKEGKLPPHMEPGLHARADYAAEDGGTYPNGAHICEVEIDEATGKVRLTRYSAVDDVGVMINPLLVEGQVLGGIGQGAGQALVEDMRYDPETGQPLTGSFLDYCMPRADDFCHFDLANNVVPTTRNPLGVKGAGEAGTVGALPAIMNAVNDALFAIGAPAVEMPASAEKLWRAIRAAKAA